MNISKAPNARSHEQENEFQVCFICGDDCESKEKYEDLIRCPCCAKEDSRLRDDRFDYIDEREARERIA
jgi:hypothetical protein